MQFKTKCVTTKNEYTDEIDSIIEEFYNNGWKLLTMTSVRSAYTGLDNDDYFEHFLVFTKEETDQEEDI